MLLNRLIQLVVASDTGILLLLIYAYSEVQFKTGGIYSANWFIKIDNERYVNIKLICDFYGPDVMQCVTCFPQFNRMGYKFVSLWVWQGKAIQENASAEKMDLLNDFGSTLTSSHHVFIDAL